jgi:hypothetical protein
MATAAEARSDPHKPEENQCLNRSSRQIVSP